MAGTALWTYRGLVRVVLPLVAPLLWLRDRASGKSRPALRERLGRDLPPVERGGLWIQAVSVGEVEVARRLIAGLAARRPDLPLMISATTATGLALAHKTLEKHGSVHPCPLDLTRPVRRVLEAVDPRALVLVETELWPEMLHQAASRGVPVAVVNARLSERSFARYRLVRPLLRPLLKPVARVAARAEADAERFAALGVPSDRIVVTGNIKYDIRPDPTPLEWEKAARRWAGNRALVVAGSTMEGEERQVLRAVEAAGGWRRIFLILAPRHPERFGVVARLLTDQGLSVARRSSCPNDREHADILLLDTIGELGRAYRLGAAAFVGGSLVSTGGHNPLEPAVWGTPVITGHHVHNFREVYAEMIAGGGAVVVRDGDELGAALRRWLDDPVEAQTAGRAALKVVEANRGAADRTADLVLELLDRRPA